VASLLALLSSILWGGADFLGGKLSKRYQAIAVTAVSQVFGLLIGVSIVLISSSWLSPSLSWDSYFISGTGQLIGMGVALTGAFFASGPEIKGGVTIKPIIFAVIAAFGFGSAVTFIARGSETSAIMTMTTMRLATLMVALLLFARYRTIGGFTKKDLPILIAIGGADFMANLLLGVATTKGLVSLAVVLGSLYPIVTALLAFRLLHERLHKVQYLGIAFAITGVVVISLS